MKAKLSEQEEGRDKVQSKLLAKKTTTSAAAAGVNDDSKKLLGDKETLIKEKQKLTEEVNKLKKEMTDAERRRTSEKEEMDKTLKEKTKQIDKLQTELDHLKSQVAGSLVFDILFDVILQLLSFCKKATLRQWTMMPAHVTSAPSLAVFRQRLTTYLFLYCYPDIVI